MPSQAYPLTEWTPDLPNGLVVAQNVRPIANGYAPVNGPQGFAPAWVGAFNGGGAFIDSTGNSTMLVSVPTGWIKWTSAGWVSGGSYSMAGRAYFAQFGDYVAIATGALMWAYKLTDGSNNAPTNRPNLIDVAQVRDFVMGITTDNAAQWSQFNNVMDWTTGVNQADKQPSLWGQLKRIVGGEYGILLSDRNVIRATYVGVEGGLDIIWQFDQISAEVGCMAAGSVCNVGRLIFFLSERGFEMCDGNEVFPIADEKINRWFFGAYSRSDIANIWSAVDPRNSVAMWAMPGTPGKILMYNWVLKKWSLLSLNVQGLFTGYTAGISLDSLDAIYGNLDAITLSLDDPTFQGGNPFLVVVDNSNVMNALTGPNLEADFSIQNLEPTPGVRSRIRSVRLITDATQASATIDARMQAGDPQAIRTTANMRSNGKMPIRANGRYNTLGITIPAGASWSYIQGCELEFEPGDAR